MTERIVPGRAAFATIVCLRHAAVVAAHRNTALGWTDAATDPAEAEREAIALKAVAAFKPSHVLAADRQRTSAAATKLAELAGATVALKRELRERNFGRWDGLAWPGIVGKDPDAAAAFLNAFSEATPPGGEPLTKVGTRVLKAIQMAAKRHHRLTVAWVADAGPIRCLLAYTLDLPLESVQRIKLDPLGLTVVRLQGDASSVAVVNAPAAGDALDRVVW